MLKFALLSLVAFLAVESPVLPPAPPTPAQEVNFFESLQQTAITVVTEGGSGSGVVITNSSGVFIWSAFHVVDGAKNIRLVKQIQNPDRTIGFFSIEADLVGFSKTNDLAVLRPRNISFFKHGAVFEAADYVPRLGDRIFHVGSFRGLKGSESFTDGVISYVGRVLPDGLAYEQISATAVPGSSGGSVFNSEGRVIGLVVSGFADTVSFVVPIRRIHAWANPDWLPDNP